MSSRQTCAYSLDLLVISNGIGIGCHFSAWSGRIDLIFVEPGGYRDGSLSISILSSTLH